MFSFWLLFLTLEICCTLNCLSEIMTIFLNYLLKVKVKVTEIRNCLKMCIFFIFKVICLQFVVILPLYLIFIDTIKCSFNTNTFLVQKCLQGQGHLISKSFGPLMKIWEYLLQIFYIFIYLY